jgi:hypothetical protein
VLRGAGHGHGSLPGDLLDRTFPLGEEVHYLQALGASQSLAHPGELLKEAVLELLVGGSVHVFNRLIE